MTRSLGETLRSGEIAVGPNLQIPSPWLVEIIGQAGFEFVVLDGEHGAAFDDLYGLILAADASGLPPLVRTPGVSRAHLMQAVDLGAQGVVVPMVDTAEQARQVVREVKYAPLGRRGFSTATRAARFGAVDAADLADGGNDGVLCIVQIESREGLANAGEIAATPGIDMILMGPADLAQSLGHSGRAGAPEVARVMHTLVDQLKDDVLVGTTAFSAEDVRTWKSAGVRFFLTHSMNPIRRAFEELRGELEP